MKYITLLLGLFCSIAIAGSDDWPSQAQIDLVEKRRANFPIATLVADVDWYEPLEVVTGKASAHPLTLKENNVDFSASIEWLKQFDNYAYIVWQNGAIRHEQYWPNFNQQSRYDTASMHKTVVALLIGIAVDEGIIDSVDDTLAKYLPEYKNDKRGKISLRSLLAMASGIKSPGFSNDSSNTYWQTYFGNDLQSAIARWPMESEPNQEFYYAGANSQYLALVIERASGQRYADYLSSKLWQPIGANDARVWLDREGGTPRASCCLQANARDWLRIGLLILNKGKVGDNTVVSETWLQQMTAASPQNPNYGWQIWRASPYNPKRGYGKGIPTSIPAEEPFAREDIVYLDGSGGQRVYIVPSENMVIVRIGAATRSWDDSALPNILLSKQKIHPAEVIH